MSNDLRYQIKQAELVENGLALAWGDDHRSWFHPVWLRHHCECEYCGTSMNAVRALRLHHIPEDISINQFDYDQQQVKIVWSKESHRYRRNHRLTMSVTLRTNYRRTATRPTVARQLGLSYFRSCDPVVKAVTRPW